MPALALGGTVEVDFFCGTHQDCDGPLDVKLARAKTHLRDKYAWVGVLENLSDSLLLLQKLLPDFFGTMDAGYWGQEVIQPSGQSGPDRMQDPGAPEPTPDTIARMRRDPLTAAEFELYDYAKTILECKMRGCGIQPGGGAQSSTSSSTRADSNVSTV